MWTRLLLALRVLRGLAGVLPSQPTCARCAEKDHEIAYWRAREERTVDRLLEARGVAPVASAPKPLPVNPMALATRAMGMTEIPPKKTDDAAAGPDASRRGAAH